MDLGKARVASYPAERCAFGNVYQHDMIKFASLEDPCIFQ